MKLPPTPMKKTGPSPAKAKQMLKDGTAQGNPLTSAQKGLFGAIAGGNSTQVPPKKAASKPPPSKQTPGGKGLSIGERPMMSKTAKKISKML